MAAPFLGFLARWATRGLAVKGVFGGDDDTDTKEEKSKAKTSVVHKGFDKLFSSKLPKTTSYKEPGKSTIRGGPVAAAAGKDRKKQYLKLAKVETDTKKIDSILRTPMLPRSMYSIGEHAVGQLRNNDLQLRDVSDVSPDIQFNFNLIGKKFDIIGQALLKSDKRIERFEGSVSKRIKKTAEVSIKQTAKITELIDFRIDDIEREVRTFRDKSTYQSRQIDKLRADLGFMRLQQREDASEKSIEKKRPVQKKQSSIKPKTAAIGGAIAGAAGILALLGALDKIPKSWEELKQSLDSSAKKLSKDLDRLTGIIASEAARRVKNALISQFGRLAAGGGVGPNVTDIIDERFVPPILKSEKRIDELSKKTGVDKHTLYTAIGKTLEAFITGKAYLDPKSSVTKKETVTGTKTSAKAGTSEEKIETKEKLKIESTAGDIELKAKKNIDIETKEKLTLTAKTIELDAKKIIIKEGALDKKETTEEKTMKLMSSLFGVDFEKIAKGAVPKPTGKGEEKEKGKEEAKEKTPPKPTPEKYGPPAPEKSAPIPSEKYGPPAPTGRTSDQQRARENYERMKQGLPPLKPTPSAPKQAVPIPPKDDRMAPGGSEWFKSQMEPEDKTKSSIRSTKPKKQPTYVDKKETPPSMWNKEGWKNFWDTGKFKEKTQKEYESINRGLNRGTGPSGLPNIGSEGYWRGRGKEGLVPGLPSPYATPPPGANEMMKDFQRQGRDEPGTTDFWSNRSPNIMPRSGRPHRTVRPPIRSRRGGPQPQPQTRPDSTTVPKPKPTPRTQTTTDFNDPIGSMKNQPRIDREDNARLRKTRSGGHEKFYLNSDTGKSSPFNWKRGRGGRQKTIKLDSGRRVTVHEAYAERYRGFLNELESRGYDIKQLGGYRSSRKQHGHGGAIDINPDQNPMLGDRRWPGAKFGTTDMPENIKYLSAKYGLAQLGFDRMHFEAVSPEFEKTYARRLLEQGIVPADDPRVQHWMQRGFFNKKEIDSLAKYKTLNEWKNEQESSLVPQRELYPPQPQPSAPTRDPIGFPEKDVKPPSGAPEARRQFERTPYPSGRNPMIQYRDGGGGGRGTTPPVGIRAPRTERGKPSRTGPKGDPYGGKIDRSSLANELNNPSIRNKIARLARGEVGDNPEAHNQFIETLANQAMAKGHSISTVMNKNYYAAMRKNSFNSPLSQNQKNYWFKKIDAVRDGANESKGMTDNASGSFGRDIQTGKKDHDYQRGKWVGKEGKWKRGAELLYMKSGYKNDPKNFPRLPDDGRMSLGGTSTTAPSPATFFSKFAPMPSWSTGTGRQYDLTTGDGMPYTTAIGQYGDTTGAAALHHVGGLGAPNDPNVAWWEEPTGKAPMDIPRGPERLQGAPPVGSTGFWGRPSLTNNVGKSNLQLGLPEPPGGFKYKNPRLSLGAGLAGSGVNMKQPPPPPPLPRQAPHPSARPGAPTRKNVAKDGAISSGKPIRNRETNTRGAMQGGDEKKPPRKTATTEATKEATPADPGQEVPGDDVTRPSDNYGDTAPPQPGDDGSGAEKGCLI